jgi:hypothetical protein
MLAECGSGVQTGRDLGEGILAPEFSLPASAPHPLEGVAAAAQEIRNCALRRTESPLPNSSTCRITQYTGAPAPAQRRSNTYW